jgi:hypothetical protein
MNADLDTLINYASTLTTLRLSAGKYYGLCPIHQEKTGSFTIDTKSGRWKCYGCGATGSNAIWLYMEINGATYQEAKKALGLWDNTRPAPRARPKRPPRKFESDDRAKCYKVARYTLVRLLDCDITYKGALYRNWQFVLSALEGHPERDEYISRIVSDMAGLNWKTETIWAINFHVGLFETS